MTPVTTHPDQLASSGRRLRLRRGKGPGTALALLAAVLVTGSGCLLAVYAAPLASRAAVAWATGVAAVLLTAAVTTAAWALYTARDLRSVIAAKDGELAAGRTENARLADETVPAVVERLRSGAAAKTALAAAPPVLDPAHQRVLDTLATEVHRGEGLRAAAMSAAANAAGRVQALATSMAADLREMQHRHQGEETLGDLLRLDHRTAQAGRMADSIAVLTGARSGRRWSKPIVMESVLRGAMGRISGYQRIRLHSTSEVAVAGHAAEGVMHALAELMDNAANFSPPTSEVHVYVEEVASGVVIMVEDGGLVMGDVALRRAEQAVSTDSPDLSALSGTRLGLPVVGRLARKHGLSVSFRPSAHGGTGVLMRIPQQLISEVRQERSGKAPAAPATRHAPEPESAGRARTGAAPRRPAQAAQTRGGQTPDARHRDTQNRDGQARAAQPLPGPRPEQAPAGSEDDTVTIEYGDSGLPKRRRGQTLAGAHGRSRSPDPGPGSDSGPARQPESPPRAQDPPPSGARPPSGSHDQRTAQQSGNRFGAFRRAVQGSSRPSGEAGAGTPVAGPTSDRPGATGPPEGSAAGDGPATSPRPRPENETE